MHLEDVGAALSEFADRVLGILARRLDRVFVDHPIPAAGQGERKERNHRCAGANGQRRKRRRRRRRPPEKVHIDRIGARHVLVDQYADALALGQQAENLAYGAAPVHDVVAVRRANPFEQIVQPRVVQRPRHDGHRLEFQCVRQRLLLPETKVSRAEQDPFALRQREPHALFAFPIHQRQLLLPGQRRVLQQLEQQSSEVLEHRPRDRPALVRRLLGERHLEICERDSPVHAIDEIEHQAKPLAHPPHDSQRQSAHEERDRLDCEVFELMPHRSPAARIARRRSASQGVKAGSMVDLERHRDDLGSDPVPVRGSDPKRTKSFSVVRITAAPDDVAARAISSTSDPE